MKIVFMGSPEFSVPCLDALAQSSHEIVAVYSQPERASGRGKKLQPTPVHARALSLGLPVHTPLNFQSDAAIELFQNHNADIAIVIAYGLILPENILNAPRFGAINLHASLLPRWRGAAPLQRAIMAGDKVTGTQIMKMEKGLDTGAVFASYETPIHNDTTYGALHDKLAQESANLLMAHLDNIPHSTPIPQSESGVVYAHKIEKREAQIDWEKPAQEVRNHIHGLSPFPGAWSVLNDERIKFLQVETVEQAGIAGEILDENFTIACKDGAIRPLILQRAGKKPLKLEEVLRGLAIKSGMKMEWFE